MQRTFFLFKIFVALTAVAVQLRVNLPTFLLQLGIGPKSVSISLAPMGPRRWKQDVRQAQCSLLGLRV